MTFEENINEISEKKGKSFVNKYTLIYQLITRLDVIRNYLRNLDKLAEISNEDIPVDISKEQTERILKELFILHFNSFCNSLRIKFKEFNVDLPAYCHDGTLEKVRHKCVAHLVECGDSEPLDAWKKLAENYSRLLDDYESIKIVFNKKLTDDLIKCGVVLK